MGKIRRTPYTFFYLEDEYQLDLPALLRGEVPRPGPEAQIVALAVLTGERHRLAPEELELLLSVPAEQWIDERCHDRTLVKELSHKGLLVSDRRNARLGRLRKRDESMSACEWNLSAAMYHYITQWSGVDTTGGVTDDQLLADRTRAAAEAFVAQHGPPPSVFSDVSGARTIRLPGTKRHGALYRTLTERRTTRAFQHERPVRLEQLDTVLRYVFGSHGCARTAADLVCMKRTSPSGGGLHPIEVYPIVSNVSDVPAGVYHYDVRDHALVLRSELEPDEARRTATDFTCGQGYFGAAHVSFVLTARFYRNHWKYRRHQKAYAGILMDAAHLSQTLYLVSCDLGLGAYVTIALNARDIEHRLELDGVSEGVIAMTGCGWRAPTGSPLELQAIPDSLA
jgi:putative peptide maturation dehydrogenase